MGEAKCPRNWLITSSISGRVYGFDKVEKVRYDVLLSLPRKDKPNAVKLLSPSGSVLVNVQGLEKVGVTDMVPLENF